MKPLLVMISISVVMAIMTPAVIPVAVTISSVVPVTVPVQISFALIPSVMMSPGCLVVVMIALVRMVASIASETIGPGVAP
jgi:hypothetical protein